jgi:golgi to ER traffic protein 4
MHKVPLFKQNDLFLNVPSSYRWSSKHGEFPAGDPELHHVVGKLFAQGTSPNGKEALPDANPLAEDNTYEAEKHLVVGTKESAEVFANMLYEWYTEDEPHTAATYAARAVLPYLLVGNIRDASRSLDVFTQHLIKNNSNLTIQEVQSASSDVKVFPSLPLLNFLSLLLLAVQTGGQDMFRTLKSHYSTHLKEATHWDEVCSFLQLYCYIH